MHPQMRGWCVSHIKDDTMTSALFQIQRFTWYAFDAAARTVHPNAGFTTGRRCSSISFGERDEVNHDGFD